MESGGLRYTKVLKSGQSVPIASHNWNRGEHEPKTDYSFAANTIGAVFGIFKEKYSDAEIKRMLTRKKVAAARKARGFATSKTWQASPKN